MTVLATDARGRITLGPKNQTFKVTELDDGSLLLEPAVVMTRADLAFATNPALQAQVEASLAEPAEGVAYRRRSPRTHA
jgi:hypothetical protein